MAQTQAQTTRNEFKKLMVQYSRNGFKKGQTQVQNI